MADAPGPSGTPQESDADEERRVGDGEVRGAGDGEAGASADGEGPSAGDADEPVDGGGRPVGDDERVDVETLRRQVEKKYDFEHFTPADMAEMTVEEWEAAFDADTWITGPALLDRVEAELRTRVARRNLFAVVERVAYEGVERVLAYTDVGYALVGPDGTVQGEGMIEEDVEPVVALCSIPDFEVSAPPADAGLPDPESVADGVGGLGDRLVLAVAAAQVIAGGVLLLSPLLFDVGGSTLFTTVAGLGFLFIGLVLGVLVANARLSGRFRAEEYRERLRGAGVGSERRPPFLPDGITPIPAADAGGEADDQALESTPD